MDLNTITDIDKHGEEKTEVEDGKDTNSMLCVNDCALEIPMGNTHNNSMSIHQDMKSLEKISFECEVPEKIRTLHQLTMQNINQVKLKFASLFSPHRLSNGSTSCGQHQFHFPKIMSKTYSFPLRGNHK